MIHRIPYARYVAILGALFLPVFLLSSFHPHHRADWLLENALVLLGLVLLGLVLLGLVLLAALHRRLPLSRISHTLIFIFLCLHEVGAQYTYAEVPYQQWFPALAGGRNHFDRLVHFSYGLLLAYPIREIFLRVAAVRGFWGYFVPLDLTMSTSMLYELVEWAAASFFGGELGAAYLGTQGDVWDAHKDMALASVGAFLAMLLTAFLNWRLQRDFALEWSDSLRVKSPAPLGEDEIVRLRGAGRLSREE